MKTEFKKELDEQLQRVSGEIKAQGVLITELQDRVSEIEDWRTAVSEAVLAQEDRVKALQDKMLDQQARSMRNNIRVFNCPESATEGKSVVTFLEELIRESLVLPEGTVLGIMRAHRALVPKPRDPEAPPRSIVANFLQFDTKELVLRTAWASEVKVDGRRIGFDHDYPPEIVKMRKEYIPLKKILKEAEISFSSPFTKLRVRWPEGTKTYTNVEEASRDVKAKLKDRAPTRRGSDSTPRDEAQLGEEMTGETAAEGDRDRQKQLVEAWSHLMKRTGHSRDAAKRAKEKMKAHTQK